MKHAIMVMGYGIEAPILQQTINILDDKNIDFFIHWDKRYPYPKLNIKKGKIYFLKDRINVNWGSFSQIEAELLLLKEVHTKNIYDYMHLISCNDLPLMSAEYFKKFFLDKKNYLGFQHGLSKENYRRIEFYYPNDIDFRKHKTIRKIFTCFNKIFRVNRLKNYNKDYIEKGPNWFSISTEYIPMILNYKNISLFENSLCGDELFVQSILRNLKQVTHDNNSNYQAARYIDWQRGNPYIFGVEDIPELKRVLNSRYAFVRKIDDPRVGKKLFSKL